MRTKICYLEKALTRAHEELGRRIVEKSEDDRRKDKLIQDLQHRLLELGGAVTPFRGDARSSKKFASGLRDCAAVGPQTESTADMFGGCQTQVTQGPAIEEGFEKHLMELEGRLRQEVKSVAAMVQKEVARMDVAIETEIASMRQQWKSSHGAASSTEGSSGHVLLGSGDRADLRKRVFSGLPRMPSDTWGGIYQKFQWYGDARGHELHVDTASSSTIPLWTRLVSQVIASQSGKDQMEMPSLASLRGQCRADRDAGSSEGGSADLRNARPKLPFVGLATLPSASWEQIYQNFGCAEASEASSGLLQLPAVGWADIYSRFPAAQVLRDTEAEEWEAIINDLKIFTDVYPLRCPENLFVGLLLAVGCLWKGCALGVYGILVLPVEGLIDGGCLGCFVGLAKGMAYFVVNPFLGFIFAVFQAIRGLMTVMAILVPTGEEEP